MIILIPTNALAASKVKELQSMQMKSKDERVKVTTEVLSGIKVNIQIHFYRLYQQQEDIYQLGKYNRVGLTLTHCSDGLGTTLLSYYYCYIMMLSLIPGACSQRLPTHIE